MDQQKYLQDIHDIKNLMSRSSQFLSLSGLSGVLAGIYALIGAHFANNIVQQHRQIHGYDGCDFSCEAVREISAIAAIVFLLAVATAVTMTFYKSKKIGERFWNATSKRLLVNFLIPLLTGGFVIAKLLQLGHYSLIASLMLIFYGLACLNGSKYTLRDVRYLAITFIVLGLLALEFRFLGLYFWAIGFGICHIIYGAIMYFKYDRKPL
ncbi:MAG: hypothetical protein IR153_06765 [Flavobacterium sp.]|nr:hypothetical protein [Flavobacterium sp.]